MKKEAPIGVFDSGIGGVTVLKQLIRFLPSESFVYLGDTARVPYGNRTPEIVNRYAEECARFLLERGVKLIVVACNTVSSVALETVQRVAGDVPVIEMIMPAARAALRSTLNNKIGIIGTRATVASCAYSDKISEYGDGKAEVFQRACPLFVPLVEEGMSDSPASSQIAEEYLAPLRDSGIDTLVLGCTHYPMLARLIGEILPGVSLVDTGEHAAVAALRALADNSTLLEETEDYLRKPKIEFYVTDLPTVFFEVAQNFLGFKIDEPKAVSIGGDR
ncbi:MAG: glutamate racemase [Chloroflexota bacterium]